ncbi:hypothetical protein PV02_12480 [Methanolobus chelungpuianus]|uniref:Uncharacterized protein n=1 Tax=Methanolobus chelungpuianus TaxID=502115 RepID=A0AAE3L2V2_9EURY|nr:hypothetical protein [Methanolobus chelungpuianus]
MIRSIPAAAKISGPGSSAVPMTPDYYVNDKSGGNPVVKKNNPQKGTVPEGTARPFERTTGQGPSAGR